ncbi:serine protease [Neochlamydia sp. EPS4]|uniref:trypsin-like serine peptidase n=1 Tax=Neochlamydia sp. EPS4 TaxID=1478175 RepID=UPI0005D12203|nr:serine protease [Neochlamydia sp. EPS4]
MEPGLKALYHDIDTRMNIYELDSLQEDEKKALYPDLANIKANALAVACLMTSNEILETRWGYKLHPGLINLSELVSDKPIERSKPYETFNASLAPTEKFRTELVAGFGSGFLVREDEILTAGHCVCVNDASSQLKPKSAMDNIRVVFRYHKPDQHAEKKIFNENDVYKIKKVLFYSFSYGDPTVADWAWVKLDRPVSGGIKPIEVDFSATMGQSIYAIGCPNGTAVKCAGVGYSTIKNVTTDQIESDLDVMAGNSGGPIIDRVANKAIAILIRGNEDYEIDKKHEKKTGERRVINFCVPSATGKYEIGQRIPSRILNLPQDIACEIPEMNGPYTPPSPEKLYSHPMVKIHALSVGCMMPENCLNQIEDDYILNENIPTFAERVNSSMHQVSLPLVGNEDFHQDPAAGLSTAFLVGPDMVLTAGQAVSDRHYKVKNLELLNRMWIVFGFKKEETNTCRKAFPKKDVYKLSNVVSLKCDKLSNWALLKLDRPVEGRDPLPIDFSPVSAGTEVYMLGYPFGTSLKLARNAQIQLVEAVILEANINGFSGNAGSPIFNGSTHKVIGLHIGGLRDHRIDEAHEKATGEKRIILHKITKKENDRMGYEKFQRISVIKVLKKI